MCLLLVDRYLLWLLAGVPAFVSRVIPEPHTPPPLFLWLTSRLTSRTFSQQDNQHHRARSANMNMFHAGPWLLAMAWLLSWLHPIQCTAADPVDLVSDIYHCSSLGAAGGSVIGGKLTIHGGTIDCTDLTVCKR